MKDPAIHRMLLHAMNCGSSIRDILIQGIVVDGIINNNGRPACLILGVVSRSDFTGTEIDRLDEEEHLKECLW